MLDPRGIVVGLAEHSPFAPPHRPQGAERRPKRDDGGSHLIRSFRSVLDQALDEAGGASRPRLTRYPY